MSSAVVMDAVKVRVKGEYLEVRVSRHQHAEIAALKAAGARYSIQSEAYRLPATPGYAGVVVSALSGTPFAPSSGFSSLLRSFRVMTTAQRYKTASRDELPAIPSTVVEPRLHQLRAYNFVHDLRSSMLAMYMGTGKSKVVVDLVVNRGHKKVLILCPRRVVTEWPGQFQIHAAAPVQVSALPLSTTTVAKAAVAQRDYAEAMAAGLPFVCVVNYESAVNPPLGPTYEEKKRANGEKYYVETAPGWLRDVDWDFLVLDESHRLKAPSGERANFVERLARQVPWVMALTGTPMGKQTTDVYKQFRILDSAIFGRSLAVFRDEYAVMGGPDKKFYKKAKNEQQLHERMSQIMFHVGREAIDLPEPVVMTRSFELIPPLRKAYRDMERDMWTQVEAGDVTAANAAVKSIRLQQLASGFAVTDGKVVTRVDDGRRKLLTEILEDIDLQDPVVVFARFVPDLDEIRQAAQGAGRNYMELSGRLDQLDAWRGAKGGEVIGVQYQAGGVGINLTRAPYCVHFSHTWSLLDYAQAVSRVDRLGQPRRVTNIHIEAAGTIDEQMTAGLREGREVAELVLEGMAARHAKKGKVRPAG